MPDLLYTMILLGAIQGFIISTLLWFTERRLLSDRILSVIMLLLALPGFHLYGHFKNWYEATPLTIVMHDMVPMVIMMPLGPLIFFYVKAQTIPQFKFRRKALWHFLPVIIDILPKLVAMIFYLSLWLGLKPGTHAAYTAWDGIYSKYADLPRWLSLTGYLILTFRFLQQSSASSRTITWLRAFVVWFAAFQSVWLIYLVPYLAPAISARLMATVDWYPVYIPLTILVYGLSIQGYWASLKLAPPKRMDDKHWVDAGWERLRLAMEIERLFLDRELNLERLAERTGLAARQVSELLNQHRALNFNAFVNQYRITEFQIRLRADGLANLTIAGLALECGFSSAATFQRIFKQATGMTPTAWLHTQKFPQIVI